MKKKPKRLKLSYELIPDDPWPFHVRGRMRIGFFKWKFFAGMGDSFTIAESRVIEMVDNYLYKKEKLKDEETPKSKVLLLWEKE